MSIEYKQGETPDFNMKKLVKNDLSSYEPRYIEGENMDRMVSKALFKTHNKIDSQIASKTTEISAIDSRVTTAEGNIQTNATAITTKLDKYPTITASEVTTTITVTDNDHDKIFRINSLSAGLSVVLGSTISEGTTVGFLITNGGNNVGFQDETGNLFPTAGLVSKASAPLSMNTKGYFVTATKLPNAWWVAGDI